MSGEWQFTDFYDIPQIKLEQPKLKKFTDITVLLDRSGSMAVIREAMEAAFDTFIKEHKVVPTTKLTLIQFDSDNDQDVVYQGVPVANAEKLSLRPRGNTPLLDAFVKAIDRTGERLSNMNESDRPDQVLMVVITDGQENASHISTRKDVFDRVTKQREAYKWQFLYLGANQDAFAEAASLGIPRDYALRYAHTTGGAAGMSSSVTSNTVSYAQNVNRGTRVKSFTPDQRKDAADDED